MIGIFYLRLVVLFFLLIVLDVFCFFEIVLSSEVLAYLSYFLTFLDFTFVLAILNLFFFLAIRIVSSFDAFFSFSIIFILSNLLCPLVIEIVLSFNAFFFIPIILIFS